MGAVRVVRFYSYNCLLSIEVTLPKQIRLPSSRVRHSADHGQASVESGTTPYPHSIAN